MRSRADFTLKNFHRLIDLFVKTIHVVMEWLHRFLGCLAYNVA